MELPKLDLKDKKILSILDMDARIPMTQLARKVGLSRQVVEYRIKRMKKTGVIFGAMAVMDSVVIGLNWYRVAFSFHNVTAEQKSEVIKFLKQHKRTRWLGEVGGNWDIVVNLLCKDNFEFNNIFDEIITKFGQHIRDYETLIYINIHDMQRTYLQEVKQRKWFYHEMKFNPSLKIDEYDKKIMFALAKDAMISFVKLGSQLGISANTVKNRVAHLIKYKVILGFRQFINPSVLGYRSHMLFLEVKYLNLQREKELYAYLKGISNISYIVKHIGRWRIGLEVETKTVSEFQDIFVDIRGKFSDIISNFESFPLFKDHAISYLPFAD